MAPLTPPFRRSAVERRPATAAPRTFWEILQASGSWAGDHPALDRRRRPGDEQSSAPRVGAHPRPRAGGFINYSGRKLAAADQRCQCSRLPLVCASAGITEADGGWHASRGDGGRDSRTILAPVPRSNTCRVRQHCNDARAFGNVIGMVMAFASWPTRRRRPPADLAEASTWRWSRRSRGCCGDPSLGAFAVLATASTTWWPRSSTARACHRTVETAPAQAAGAAAPP